MPDDRVGGGDPVGKNRPFKDRLGFAIAGLASAFRRERSLRLQSAMAAAAIVTLLALRPGWMWAALVTLTISLVFALELLNSALETVLDELHPSRSPRVKFAKDVAAGAVLVTSAASVAVGMMMLADVLAGRFVGPG